MMPTVVTGMGVVSTAGFDLETFWHTLEAGNITYGEIEDFKNNSNYRITIGAVINDTSWNRNLPKNIVKNFGKAANYAVSAALNALEDAGLKPGYLPRDRTAVILGTKYKYMYGRAAQYCITAALSALKNANIDIIQLPRVNVAVVLSTTM